MNDATRPTAARLADLVRFYGILTTLERNIGSSRKLAECFGRMGWPRRGVYFFFEDGESRSDAGNGLRVVRVGTHSQLLLARNFGRDFHNTVVKPIKVAAITGGQFSA
jgi:hypothetical protein